MTTPSICTGGSHDLKPVPTDTLAHYAAPSPTPRSRSPKPAVTMPKRSVTINRDARSRWTGMTGHVRRNTQWDTWRPADGEILHSFSMLTINADEHPLMRRFHAPGDEKRSLGIVPAEKREAWLAAEDPRDFLLPLPAEEYMASSSPLPPRKSKIAPPEQQELLLSGII